jgi:hypothetical protein
MKGLRRVQKLTCEPVALHKHLQVEKLVLRLLELQVVGLQLVLQLLELQLLELQVGELQRVLQLLVQLERQGLQLEQNQRHRLNLDVHLLRPWCRLEHRLLTKFQQQVKESRYQLCR